jgi:hypothetical protein
VRNTGPDSRPATSLARRRAATVWKCRGRTWPGVPSPCGICGEFTSAGVTAPRPEQNYRIEVSHPVLLGGAGHAPAELDLHPDRPDYVTTDGVDVRIERKRQKTRFLDGDGRQAGPVHRNLVPAIIWARAQGMPASRVPPVGGSPCGG